MDWRVVTPACKLRFPHSFIGAIEPRWLGHCVLVVDVECVGRIWANSRRTGIGNRVRVVVVERTVF